MNDNAKLCPVCGEIIEAVATQCRYCNTDLITYLDTKAAEAERILFTGHPVPLCYFSQWVVVIFTLGIAYVFYWARSLSTTYEITTQRVRIERGIFSKLKESVELFRIDYFDLLKPLGMRLGGQCLLCLHSTDASFPTVSIFGIPDLESLAYTLREYSLHESARSRVTTLVQARDHG